MAATLLNNESAFRADACVLDVTSPRRSDAHYVVVSHNALPLTPLVNQGMLRPFRLKEVVCFATGKALFGGH
jgi:hypothetical protein